MSEDVYCNICDTDRADTCSRCMDAELADKDKEIASLRAALLEIFNEVTSGPYYPFSNVGVIAKKALEANK